MKFATVKFTQKTAISCALLATFLGSLSATAVAGAGQLPNLADLDLTQSAGVTTAYARIRSAARKACEPQDVRVLVEVARANRCAEQMIARMVDGADASALTAYYQSKIGLPTTVGSRQ
jgi:UrcA family protein